MGLKPIPTTFHSVLVFRYGNATAFCSGVTSRFHELNYFSADFLSLQLVDFLTYLGAISGYILTSNVVSILFLLIGTN